MNTIYRNHSIEAVPFLVLYYSHLHSSFHITINMQKQTVKNITENYHFYRIKVGIHWHCAFYIWGDYLNSQIISCKPFLTILFSTQTVDWLLHLNWCDKRRTSGKSFQQLLSECAFCYQRQRQYMNEWINWNSGMHSMVSMHWYFLSSIISTNGLQL